jgi:hypothetical protein
VEDRHVTADARPSVLLELRRLERDDVARSDRGGAGIDPVEAGRRGGVASGISRRRAPLRRLEQAIENSRNGAAIFALYRTRLERDQALEREILYRDRQVVELIDAADEERARIAQLRERAGWLESELRGNIEALEARESALRAAIDASEAELVVHLREPTQPRPPHRRPLPAPAQPSNQRPISLGGRTTVRSRWVGLFRTSHELHVVRKCVSFGFIVVAMFLESGAAVEVEEWSIARGRRARDGVTRRSANEAAEKVEAAEMPAGPALRSRQAYSDLFRPRRTHAGMTRRVRLGRASRRSASHFPDGG